MSLLQAAFLGFVQGVTEFLPVSSSGHLVLFQRWLGVQNPDISFEVFLHVATLGAVVLFFWQEIWNIRKNWSLLGALIVGTIPAVIVGLVLKDSIESLFNSITLVSFALMVTGILNLLSDWKMNQQRAVEEGKLDDPEAMSTITPRQGLMIGVIQAIAITPGISRSGSTVFGGMMVGLKRIHAFTFSFLLSIPAILGATVLQIKDIAETGLGTIQPLEYMVGGLVALITGLASLYLLRIVMLKAQFQIFGWYCLLLGSISLASTLL